MPEESKALTRFAFVPVYLWAIRYLKPYAGKLAALVLCGFAATVGEMAIPKATQYVIDDMMPTRDWHGFATIVGILAVLLPVVFAARAGRTMLERIVSEKASRDLQFAVLRHLRSLGVAYYEQHPVGSTLSLMNTDLGAAQGLYRWQLPYLFQQFAMLTALLAFMASIDWRLSLLILPPAVLFYLLGPKVVRKTFQHAHRTSELRNEQNKKAYESVSALYELRASGAYQWDIDRLADKQNAVHDSWTKQLFYSLMRSSLGILFSAAGLVLVVLAASVLIRGGTLTVGQFVAFLFYYFAGVSLLIGIMNNMSAQRVSMFQVKRIYDLMARKPLVQEAEPTVVIPEVRGNIRFGNVHFRYAQGAPVLAGLQLDIRAGEHVAIVGTSGGGKSTLLKLVARFYDPTEGQIELDGVPLQHLSLDQLHETVGYVFQEMYLFGSSVRDNLMFGNPDASEEEMVAAARQAAAHEFIAALPDGYDTIVGERGIKLSGGQKQRISIARMILNNPRIVLLDEATSALDRVNEKEVQQALDRLLQGRTTLTVAHRISTIEHYDRIVLLQHGIVAEQGTYTELMAAQGEFYRLVKGEETGEEAS
ncbi:MAG: ABC transporter ATP-binding protein [Paenibacillaceae bacterium]|nr:ABC transporter ATP-binding protein [Paenibacillaceae bacterium]